MQDLQTLHDAADINESVEDVMHGKYMTFIVGDVGYGIEISCVVEIISVVDITLVPHTHDYLKGIINLRGTVVPVIDMNMRFGNPESVYTDKTCIIVLEMKEISVGILVDSVKDVTNIDDENIQDPPKQTGNTVQNNFIKSVGVSEGEVLQLIDVITVFDIDVDSDEKE